MFTHRPSGSVTVVQHLVHTNYARNAKVAFFATTGVVGLLVAAVLVSSNHPIVAVVLGGLIGATVGVCVAVVVRVWPVARMLWWWATEIACLLTLVWLFALMSAVPSTVMRVGVLAVVAGLMAGIPPVRRSVVAVAWCVITRHRLRVCFNDVIKSNQHGSLPLILWARPTAVGERVWIFLRPGLSKTDLANRLERLAVVCWASAVTVEQPGSNAAFLRLDVKRRDVLNRTITSPLVHNLTPGTPAKPSTTLSTTPVLVPSGLDLDSTPLVAYKPSSAQAAKKPAATADPHNGGSAKRNGDPDLKDWI
jgi:hypothetical protein